MSLREAARRGLVTIAHTQCKKTPPNRLGKQDEAGMSLVHHAALFNRAHVLTLLVLFSLDVNVRRHNLSLALGIFPVPIPIPIPLRHTQYEYAPGE